MRTISIDMFTFNELSDEAKQVAINNNREINVDYEWWDFTYEDFIENSVFDIDNIYFSGFYSQGDGAMFEYSSIPDKLKIDFVNQLKLSSMRKNWLLNNVHVSGNGKHRGYYYHENSCSHNIYWEVDNGDLHWETNFYQWLESFADDFEDYVISLYKDECRKLYRELERGYDYLTSDEAVAETLILNEYEFTEDGRRN
jgi:hypothetical protein